MYIYPPNGAIVDGPLLHIVCNQIRETMYLINTTSLKLEYFPDERGIRYAILSHCWGSEEVLFKDMVDQSRNEQIKKLSGYDKILQCCRLAKESDLDYAWVDTCCIDKSSSAELQEAINSMFRWYQSATVCYAHLADVNDDVASEDLLCISQSRPTETQFGKSKWFRRGWTLQELLAPDQVIFFTRSWSRINTRNELAHDISEITGIRREVLQVKFDPDDRPRVAKIMSWARDRETTRVEDRAYSLLGLFDVNMPMLYGEGEKAFKRLQEEIMRNTLDYSIFAWSGLDIGHKGLFAPSPDNFVLNHSIVLEDEAYLQRHHSNTITSQVASITMDLICWRPFIFVGILSRYHSTEGGLGYVGIYLQAVDDQDCYIRVPYLDNALANIAEPFNKHILHDRPVNILYKLNSSQGRLAKQPMIPYRCKVRFNDSSANMYHGSMTLCDSATWGADRNWIVLRDGSAGSFCKIQLLPHDGLVKWHRIDSPIQIELGLDCQFLPFCILGSHAGMVSFEDWTVHLHRRRDPLVWHKAAGASPKFQTTIKHVDASTTEYAFLPIGHDAVAVRTQSSFYGKSIAGWTPTRFFNIQAQFEAESYPLTLQIVVNISQNLGWKFQVIIT